VFLSSSARSCAQYPAGTNMLQHAATSTQRLSHPGHHCSPFEVMVKTCFRGSYKTANEGTLIPILFIDQTNSYTTPTLLPSEAPIIWEDYGKNCSHP
jgi:hypothetical protein